MVRRDGIRRLAHRIVVIRIRRRRPRDCYAQLLRLGSELIVEEGFGAAIFQQQHFAYVVVVVVFQGQCALGVLHVCQGAFLRYRSHPL